MKILKDKIRTVVRIEGYRLEGVCHIVPRQRFSDFLNSQKVEFVIMTDVKWYKEGSNDLVDIIPFVGINKSSIITIYPIEEKPEKKKSTRVIG